MGGFGKHPGDYPDILHSFYSLCWLSIADNSPSSEDGDSSDGLDASNVSLGLQKINPITGFIK